MMDLWRRLQLDLDRHRAVTLVGGGGKTTLMYALAQAARARGKTVIVTTTTRIMPHPRLPLVDRPDPETLRAALEEYGVITLGTRGRADKLCGTGEIAVCKMVADLVIIEGDGAKFLPLKAPAEHEPVIPPETDVVVAVAGMDALGRPIGETCHRAELVCALLGKKLEDLVEPADVVRMLSAPQGGRKCVSQRMAFRCALNKADPGQRAEFAQEIVALLAAEGILAVATVFEEKERGGLCWF